MRGVIPTPHNPCGVFYSSSLSLIWWHSYFKYLMWWHSYSTYPCGHIPTPHTPWCCMPFRRIKGIHYPTESSFWLKNIITLGHPVNLFVKLVDLSHRVVKHHQQLKWVKNCLIPVIFPNSVKPHSLCGVGMPPNGLCRVRMPQHEICGVGMLPRGLCEVGMPPHKVCGVGMTLWKVCGLGMSPHEIHGVGIPPQALS